MSEKTKPLVAVTVYNRPETTAAMLESYAEHTDLDEVVTVIVDDCSDAETARVVDEWCGTHGGRGEVHAIHRAENGGTARAINDALRAYWQEGRALVKLDNDILFTTSGWVERVGKLVRGLEDQGHGIALVRAHRTWRGVELPNEKPAEAGEHDGFPLYEAERDLGYAVWYTAAFIGRVRFFEVLGPDHRYGYDDSVMGHKANLLGWFKLIDGGWRVVDQARGTAVADKDEQRRMGRELLRARLHEMLAQRNFEVGPDGVPVGRKE